MYSVHTKLYSFAPCNNRGSRISKKQLPVHNNLVYSPRPRPYSGCYEANQQRQDSTFGDSSGAPLLSPKLLSNPGVLTGASYQDYYKISLDFVDVDRGSRKADKKRARQAKATAKCRETKKLDPGNGLAEQVCFKCKVRKRKCSKELPSCSGCTR
jgi:hypothetical protein